ncbi:MAG TPA: hypothetical protein P5246_06205 [Candidatus Omnitrophota bacterium]|nr:hypothetical protein [Candidatus Omnitrophota bacterium]HSA31674.1 hypothetical protein [Candidatus Omnitrophota bacterium]
MAKNASPKTINSKPVIIFPYLGYENNKKCEWYFWWTVDRCKEIDPRPIVVLPRDTVIRQDAASFIKDARYADLEVVQTWSVDTCQTWLAGWGHVLDHYPEVERIVQIPGDIDYVDEDVEFYDNLRAFIQTTTSDIVIGDFRTGDQYSAKSLVDTYGTYSLLANWFPEVSQSIRSIPLNRPRSEFLNIKTSVLRELIITNRCFAYEQTLNFLIKCWDNERTQWKYNISKTFLGTLSDNKSFRNYRACIDQIERTERMLSLLWREIKQPKKNDRLSNKEFEQQYTVFSDEYDKLYTKSKGIMETARTTLRALLGV